MRRNEKLPLPLTLIGGEWVPAIPLPFYYGLLWWPLRGRYGCECGRGFWLETSYEIHWLMYHASRENESR